MVPENLETMMAEYRKHTLRKVMFIVLCFVVMFIAVAVSITVGGYDIS